MSFTAKSCALLVAVFLATLGLNGFLNFNQFRNTLAALTQARFSFVVFDIQNTVENNLALGLPLNVLRDTQDVIERQTAQDPQILSIIVYDAKGIALFSTDRGGIGEIVPSGWLTPRRTAAAQALWTVAAPDAFVVGVPLRNSFGQTVGGLALRYSRAYFDDRVRLMALKLAKAAGGIALLFLPLAIVGVLLIYRGTRHDLRRLAEELRGSAQTVATAARVPGPGPGPARSTALGGFHAGVAGTLAGIDAAERQVDQLDEQQ